MNNGIFLAKSVTKKLDHNTMAWMTILDILQNTMKMIWQRKNLLKF